MDTRASNIEQGALNLSLVTKSESHQLLFEWNNTQADYPNNKCIHQLFESQVEQTPDNIAVSFDEKQLTYRELNCQANKVAHYLQTLNVGPEVIVGICLERSLDLVIGLLGILKAGGAYLPLDTSYQPDRLRFILEDAEVPILLTQRHFIDLPECGTHYICLDTDWQAIAKHSPNNELSEVTPNNLAYVIYTSGSTGKPKGVAMPHRPLVNLLTWQLQNFRTPRARTLQFTPISFDVSFQEIFSTLCSGGTLVLVSDSTRRNSEALLQYLCEQTIERLFLPYIALQHLAEVAKNQITLPIYLREVITAGEQLKITHAISQWFRRLEDCSLENQYGPSESHVVTAYRLSGSPQDWPHLPPIGRPIANTQIYLLNPKLRRKDDPAQLVPIGEPGELAIAGVSLARGYLNKPELTNSKFILDPFSDEPGARLYRTGDLARYRPDGTLEFIERLDHQVKIRGFRVELGEIEVTLNHHPAVKDVVVVAREDSLDNKRLVAYVATKNSKSGDTMALQLRTELQESLPDYMLPSAFVFMDALPLTSSGKVDRRSLPEPNRQRPALKEDFVPPSTQVEEQLAEIWSQVLGIEPVGIHDNFFDLGGNSLQTIQLIFKVRETFQAELPIASLFDAPTIAKFAEFVNASICSRIIVTSDDTTISELEAEAALDPTIAPSSFPIFASEPENIFITGVTGFLGAFLLHELFEQTQAMIYCLVRSSSPESGKQKIKRNLEHYLLGNEEFYSRIIPVLGDLSQPLLGLTEHQFRKLASEIDLIYHNGALVNLIYPYTALRATNVFGTQEILRLASQIKVKPVHFISTVDLFQSAHYLGRKVIHEQDALDYSEGFYNGYAQSKWVAEKLMMTARVRGIPVCIYRPAMIAGHSQTGVSHTDDMMCRMIKGFIQLGFAPDLDLMVNMSPVDYVSRAIIHLSRQKETLGKVFHLVNPHSLHLSKFVKEINSLGYPMQQIAYDKWQAELRRNVNISQKNALSALVSLFAEGISEKQMTYLETSSLEFQSFDCQNTVNGLAGTAIVCPPLDARLLSIYFSYFTHSGFLNTSHLTKTATYFDKKINSFSQNGWCETKSAFS